MPKKSKFHDLFIELKKNLGPVFTETILNNVKPKVIEENLDLVALNHEISEEDKIDHIDEKLTKYLFGKVTEQNPFEDFPQKNRSFFSFKESPTSFEIAVGYRAGKYFSNESALYLNDLITSPPSNHYLASEKKRVTTKQNRSEYSFTNVKRAFEKKARTSNNYISNKKEKIYLLEKEFINKKGVIKRTIKFEGYNEIEVEYTNKERTIVDSIITPHYSGGMANIIEVIAGTELNVTEVASIIKEINPYYPFWQVIGFIFNKLGRSKAEESILQFFSSYKMVDFFLEREFQQNWDYDSKWRIYYPQNINKLFK